MPYAPPPAGRLKADKLAAAVKKFLAAPLDGARDLPVLTGLKPNRRFTEPQDNVLVRAADALVGSGRVFRYGTAVVYQTHPDPRQAELLYLLGDGAGDLPREAHLANLVVCRDGDAEFPVPGWFADTLLASEFLREKLPEVKAYARRPVFDAAFVLRGPGWHPGPGVLVHGPAVDPLPWPDPPAVDPAAPDVGAALARLPHHLRHLLAGFCFKAPADLANAVAFLLTGLLVNHFVTAGKPIALVDGNQPGTGKTLLAKAQGLLLDGVESKLVGYKADDAAFEKEVGAALRGRPAPSAVVIDNARVPAGDEVKSAFLERVTTAAVINTRVLGTSTEFVRPNDVLWAMTMNDTRAARDVVRRGLPVRLEYEGDPRARTFPGPDPLAYARTHRLELLGELAGMVVRWQHRGRPAGDRPHSLAAWAGVVGGVLGACGLPEFLGNLDEAATAFDPRAEGFAALAEHVLRHGGPVAEIGPGGPVPAGEARGLRPIDWVPHLEAAGVLEAELRDCTTDRARGALVGKFFVPQVNKPVAVDLDGRAGTATLRVEKARANAKEYHLEVVWAAPGAAADAPAVEAPAALVPDPVVAAPAVGSGEAAGNGVEW